MTYQLLIAEDEPDISELIVYALEEVRQKVTIYTARNGVEALKIIADHPRQIGSESGIGLVVTDLLMHLKGGIELITEAKAISPGTKYIAVTAVQSPDKEAKVKELGAELLRKPFTIDKLVRLVERHITA